jgi:hypothetical protein
MRNDRMPLTAASKAWRVLAAVAVFGVVGPPVGGLATWVTMGTGTLRSPMPFVTSSYAEGVVLAIAAGVLIGVAALWFGSAPWPIPIGVVVIVNVAMLVTTVVANPPDFVAAMIRVVRVFFPASLAATFACWLLTRRLLRFA